MGEQRCTTFTGQKSKSRPAVLVLTRDQLHMAGFAQQPAVQGITATLIGFREELDDTDLASVAVLVVGASQTLHSVAVCTVVFGDNQLITGVALGSVLSVVILETVNLSNLPLGKCLLSDLLFTRRAGETEGMVRSLQSSDHVVRDDVTTRPAQFQTGLVAVVTQWDPGLVVVLFPGQRGVTGATLETTFVVRPVQGLDGGLGEGHGFTTEATHLSALCGLIWVIRTDDLGLFTVPQAKG